MTKRFDVFLSHNSKDKLAVRELAEALRARGLQVWLDEWELVPGRPWQEALEEIIETTRSSAVLVGKDGLGPWQDAEMRGCLSEFVERKLPVIPVLLPGAPEAPRLPLFLKRFTWIDLRGGLTEEGIDRLQWGATGKRPDRLIPTAAPEAAVAEEPRDFFISYTQSDEAWAEWIAYILTKHGRSSIQYRDFQPETDFLLEINRGIRQANCCILIMSRKSLVSEFLGAELTSVLVQGSIGDTRRLMPVKIDDCEPSGLLAPIQYIDLVGLSEERAEEALLSGLGLQYTPPPLSFPGSHEHTEEVSRKFPRPRIFNTLRVRNKHLVGRDELVEDLHRQLAVQWTVALIHGLGGVGKTQLALEYAHRYAQEYEVVWWLRAEKKDSLLPRDYTALAQELGLSEWGNKNLEVVAQAVRSWLGKNSQWLLIFDNALSQDALQAYLPPRETGHVLITSRNKHWDDLAKPIQVQVLLASEATKLLLDRSEQADEKAAAILAQILGYLPLALAQAAAYIRETQIPIAKYLDLYASHRRELWQKGKLYDYGETIATTWSVAFEQIKQEGAGGAADLLNICAILSPEEHPLSMFIEKIPMLPTSLNNEVKILDAVVTLGRFSLIDYKDNKLAVHRLVRDVTRDRLSEIQTAQYEGVVSKLLSKETPTQEIPAKEISVKEILRPSANARDWANEVPTKDLAKELPPELPVCFELVSLNCWYGARQALKSIDLKIPKNVITAVIGPSGTGKSTLLRCLAGLTEVEPELSVQGRVLLNGRDIYEGGKPIPRVTRHIGIVFQTPNVFPRSVYDNIAYGPRLHGIRRRRELDEIVERALRATDLWDQVKDNLDSNAQTLPFCSQWLLTLARAVALEPEVLLLDTIFSPGPISQARVEELFQDLKLTCTLVITTNNMQMASRVSDYIAFLAGGELVELGSTERIFINPIKKLTEDFIIGRLS